MDALVRCAAAFAHHHPDEAAARLECARPADAVGFLDHLEPVRAANVLGRMAPAVAAACLELMEDPRAAAILDGLEGQRRVRVLRQVAPGRREQLLAALPDRTAQPVRRALALPEGSAGAMADTSVKALPEDLTAGAARAATEDLKVPYLYVVDRDQRLVGVIHRRDVNSSGDDVPLGDVLSRDVTRIPAHATVAQLHRHRAWRDLDALPVVDGKGIFLGAIRHKELRRLRRAPQGIVATSSPFSILLDLAELFWVGLSDVLKGLSATTDVKGGSR